MISLLQVPLLALGVIFLMLALLAHRNSEYSLKKYFVLYAINLSGLSFSYFLETLEPSLFGKELINGLEYLSFASLPPTFIIFLLLFLNRWEEVTRFWQTVLFIPSIITLIAVITNPWHHLYYTRTFLFDQGGLLTLGADYGPFYWFFIIFSFLMFFMAFALLLLAIVRGRIQDKRQAFILMFALSSTGLGASLWYNGFIDMPINYVMVMTYSFFGLALYLVAFRVEVFVLIPLTSTIIVDSMKDATIALDVKRCVVRMNPSAEKMLGMTESEAKGRHAHEVLEPFFGKRIDDINGRYTVGRPRDDGTKTVLDIKTAPLFENARKVGSLIIVRDISQETAAKEALLLANTKLNLITTISRYDMHRQVKLMESNLDTIDGSKLDNPRAQRFLDDARKAVENVSYLFGFAAEYQKVGLEAPQWQGLNDIMNVARMAIPEGKARMATSLDGLQVFGDKLLERVFFNLCDNSIRHGQRVTSISLRHEIEDGKLVLIYEDDGIGVIDADKPRIFDLGFGKNTGFGLAMCRQVLGLSGWTINETGIPGIGVRFEITVPPNAWRWNGGAAT